MKSIIRWAINNSPAMNTLLIASMLVGAFSFIMMRREVFPEFELDIVLVSVPYPGASPDDVEAGICQKIEEACQPIKGIRKQTSVAQEGAGFLILELEAGSNVQKVLSEVRSEIDQISSWPEFAKDPEIQEITFRMPAIQVGVIGPDDDSLESRKKLRNLTETIRNELLQEPIAPARGFVRRFASTVAGNSSESSGITSADINAAPPYQIDVAVSENTLREHGLTLDQIAQIIRKENLELPSGNIKSAGHELLLRGKSKRVYGDEISRIPLLTPPGGKALTVGDLGVVVDGFEDQTAVNRVNGNPALVVGVERTSTEDLFAVVDTVYQYVERKQAEMPPGYKLVTWNDQSVDVEDRMAMLLKNGLGGLILVFLVLAVFLELRLAFWVALGIPISVLGSGIVLIYAGATLNMLSMFAFLMALGIVVDDAIVIGENIFEHRQLGKSAFQAAVDGTIEVLPSVTASVSTTIIAFSPLLFVAGIMGKFIAVMPLAVIAMLAISLVESMLILPCHLGHENNLFLKLIGWVFYPVRFINTLFIWLNKKAESLMQFMIKRTYLPTLDWCIANKPTVFAGCFSVMLMTVGMVASGMTPFVIFPKLDSRLVQASVAFPDGSPQSTTEKATRELERAIIAVNDREKQRTGKDVVEIFYRNVGTLSDGQQMGPSGISSGAHVGSVEISLVPVEEREISSQEIVAAWRAETGKIAGYESLKYVEAAMGPGGTPIEFQLLADKKHVKELEAAVEACKAKLRTFPGVQDVEDDSRPGKWEVQISRKPNAEDLNISLDMIVQTVRSAFYGSEVDKLQRFRHEVKLMVRYPESERRSLQDLQNIKVLGSDGEEYPVTEVADIQFARSYSEINRINQLRSITVSADVDEAKANAREITAELKATFFKEEFPESFPDIYVRWEGQQQQTAESVSSLFRGLMIALLAMFVLLTVEFRSYLQPAIIMAIIPFGLVGAILGHLFMNLEVTLFSLFGVVALTGVVVNDSIVLVDFINKKRRELPLREALLEAGRRRFRPVLLTSMTTIAGLIPMLLEQSFQAQILIPMATSLCFGLLFATFLVLILVPVFFDVYARIVGLPHELDTTPSESEVEAVSSHESPSTPINEPQLEPAMTSSS